MKGTKFCEIPVEKTNEDFKMSYTYHAEDTNTLLNFIEKIDAYVVEILKNMGGYWATYQSSNHISSLKNKK